MIDFSQQNQYQVMHGVLNERQWRLYVATEAKRRGPGGISQVAREAGVTRKTIRKGLQEMEAGELYEPGGRIRRKGGGRKQITCAGYISYPLRKLRVPLFNSLVF
ncbi:MAG TPA: hypothetical protein VGU68_15485 [Ktedonobacteraceae bacterium]|nr:hypothetical protein [Ktedonobacteraceae bacterium]